MNRQISVRSLALWLGVFTAGFVVTRASHGQVTPRQRALQEKQQQQQQLEELQRRQQQQLPPNAEQVDCEGTIETVQGDIVGLKTDREKPWLFEAPRGKANVLVEGSAEASFLMPGQIVRFVGEIDDKGALLQPVDKLLIVAPTGHLIFGLYKEGAEDDAKPEKKTAAGEYEIRGRVASFKEGHLMVTAGGRKISGMLAEGAEISVKLTDMAYAQTGDEIRVKGWYYPDAQQPGVASRGIAEEVTITLNQPLTGTKKGKGARVVGKTPRLKVEKTPDQDQPDPNDPFGVGKQKSR